MEKMKHIEEGYEQLLDTWERRQDDYQKALNYLIFMRDAEQAEMWIVSQEAFIGNEDVGVSWLYACSIDLFQHSGACRRYLYP